jgi:hypothetical protein
MGWVGRAPAPLASGVKYYAMSHTPKRRGRHRPTAPFGPFYDRIAVVASATHPLTRRRKIAFRELLKGAG